MDINLLVLAVGNSRLHVGVFVAGEMKHVRHFTHAQQRDWDSLIKEIWKEIDGAENAEVCGCSVVPGLLEQVESAVRDATGQTVQWIGRDVDLPIKVLTKTPETTGIDRALICAAAFEQLEKACVVVDAGTAFTVNLVNEKGELVGGAIAPGVGLMIKSMNEGTAKLPSISFEVPTSSYGADTIDAMRHGITQSLRGLVQNMAERWAEVQGTWPEVIAAGGDAHALFDGWEIIHAISPDLLLYGVALAYTNHHLKHGT